MTNYEKIHGMSIEELATLLDSNGSCYLCVNQGNYCKDCDCKQGILQYLKQEAEK